MIENQLPLDKHQENSGPMASPASGIATAQTYTRSTGTNIGDRLAKDENTPTISPQTDAYLTGTSTGEGIASEENAPTILPQPNANSPSKGISPVLARVLTGGLIGLTLGTLAGAFANKKTAKAVNNAAIGVGDGAKIVAEGINHSAKGVGDVVKSVTEGVNYAVIGAVESLKDSAEDAKQSAAGAVESLKDTAENAKQFAVDAVKDIAENTKQSTVGAVDAVKDTAENAKQSAIGAVDAVKDIEDVKPSEAQNYKLDEEWLATGKYQVPTSEVSIGQVETQMPDTLVVDETIPVDAVMPVVFGEPGFPKGDERLGSY